MPDDLHTDPLLRSLAGLSALDLDPARAASLRAHCHAVLEHRQRRRVVVAFLAADFFRSVLEPAVIGSACALYLVEVVRRAAALFGL